MSADSIFLKQNTIDQERAYYTHDDAFAFFVYFKHGVVLFSYQGDTHSDILENDDNREMYNNLKSEYETPLKIRGRIWVDRKLISFWDYDFSDINIDSSKSIHLHAVEKNNTLTFRETLKLIENEFNVEHENIHFDEEWLIDVPVDFTNVSKDTYTVYDNTYTLMSLDEFEKGVDIDTSGLDNAANIHLMDQKQREEYYKKHGRPKGWGSDKSKPVEFTHALGKWRGESMKYLKSFENFDL